MRLTSTLLRNERGLSLLSIMMGVTLLGVATLGLAQLNLITLKRQVLAGQHSSFITLSTLTQKLLSKDESCNASLSGQVVNTGLWNTYQPNGLALIPRTGANPVVQEGQDFGSITVQNLKFRITGMTSDGNYHGDVQLEVLKVPGPDSGRSTGSETLENQFPISFTVFDDGGTWKIEECVISGMNDELNQSISCGPDEVLIGMDSTGNLICADLGLLDTI